MDNCKCKQDTTLEDYKSKLNTTLLTEWTRLMGSVLSVAELVSIPTQWRQARAKLLREMNDFIRIMRKELDLPLDSQEE